AAFEASYQASFSRLLPGIPVRIVNLRTTAVGVRPPFDLAALAPRGGSLEAAARGNRRVWFDGGWQATKIWDRMWLPVGARLAGPAAPPARPASRRTMPRPCSTPASWRTSIAWATFW